MTTGCRPRRLTRRRPRKQSVRISARGLEPRPGRGRLHGQVPLDTIFRDVLTGQRTSDLKKVDGTGKACRPRRTRIRKPRMSPDEPPANSHPGRAAKPTPRKGLSRRRALTVLGIGAGALIAEQALVADGIPPSDRARRPGQVRAPRTQRLRPRRHRGPGRGPAPRCGRAARQPVPPEPGEEHHVPAVPRPRTDAPLVPPELRRDHHSRAARRLGEARLADPRPHDRPPAVRLSRSPTPTPVTATRRAAAGTWSASSPRSRPRTRAGVSTPATCPRSPRVTSTSWSRASRSGRRTT